MALTKKQEQEARAAAADQARVDKLKAQLAEAESKLAERANKQRDEILAAIQRKADLIDSKNTIIETATKQIEEYAHDIEVLRDQLDEIDDVEDEDNQDD